MHTKLRAVALAATLALTAGGLTTAQAHHGTSGSQSLTKLTGGETTIALSDAAKSGLSGAGITATPIDPATANSGTFTFPIAGGKVKSTTAFGFVALKGGVKLTKGDKTVRLRHLLIASGPRGAALFAATKRHGFHRFSRRGFRHRGHKTARATRHRGHRFARWQAVLRLTNVKRADAGARREQIVITADAALTRRAAKLLNHKFATTAFSAGDAVGTVTVSATS
jgi:hypothetical protein